MPPFKDEHVLIIIPGSLNTIAQLGVSDAYAPTHQSFKTRMFPAPGNTGLWEPYKLREVNKTAAPKPESKQDGDVEMGGTEEVKPEADGDKNDDDEPEYEEDRDSDEGAVWPIQKGRITNMSALLSFLQHIHTQLSPTLHTPILLVTQPAWTASDIEELVKFIFEKFKTPALTVADSALVTAWAYGLPNAAVIDIGYEKAEVGVVSEHLVASVGRGIAIPDVGGEAMTQNLLKLLGDKGWNYDMCEALKRSPLCEILPAGTPLPGPDPASGDKKADNPAAASSINVPSAPTVQSGGVDDAAEEEAIDGQKVVDDEGVLDVASIVASGKTAEFLAAQEKKKAAAAARKVTRDAKIAAEAAEANRPIKLPNSKREKVTFHYEDKKAQSNKDEPVTIDDAAAASLAGTAPAGEDKPAEEKAPEPASADAPAPVPGTEISTDEPAKSATIDIMPSSVSDAAAEKAAAARAAHLKSLKAAKKARDQSSTSLEVGVERFQACPTELLERVADALHHAITSGVEPSKRAEVWDNIVIVGGGSQVRGYRERLLEMIRSKYLISPSSATIFTSELPSNLSTPMGTGSQTPQREGIPGQQSLPQFVGGSGVNPLLLAATTSSLNVGQGQYTVSGQLGGGQMGGGHSSHSQTPTSVRFAKMPEYYPEWKNQGTAHLVALGAQVMAKVIFIVDQGQSQGFMTRVQYNEAGPSGVHQFGLTLF